VTEVDALKEVVGAPLVDARVIGVREGRENAVGIGGFDAAGADGRKRGLRRSAGARETSKQGLQLGTLASGEGVLREERTQLGDGIVGVRNAPLVDVSGGGTGGGGGSGTNGGAGNSGLGHGARGTHERVGPAGGGSPGTEGTGEGGQ
jgi:hypothetical protein